MKTKSSQQTLRDEYIQQRAYLFTWLRGLSLSEQQQSEWASSNERKCDLGEWTPYARNCLRIYEEARDDLGRYGAVRCAARARLPLHHWLAPAKNPPMGFNTGYCLHTIHEFDVFSLIWIHSAFLLAFRRAIEIPCQVDVVTRYALAATEITLGIGILMGICKTKHGQRTQEIEHS